MYRDSRKRKTKMPSHVNSTVPSFVALPDSPSGSSTSSSTDSLHLTFLERISNLPLVRAAVDRVQVVYDGAKELSGPLRGILETGENTVTYSWTRAADVLAKSGLSQRLERPLSMVDSTACYVLNKVEEKLPIVSKSPYEIKLMISDKVDSRVEQITSVKDNTVRMWDDYKAKGAQIGTAKIQAVLETPVGQKINQTLERSLSLADTYVDRYLPESGHSIKNGNGTANGNYTHTNGYHNGTLDHAKSLSRKVKRRVSAKVSDDVDGIVEKYPVARQVVGLIEGGRRSASRLVGKARTFFGTAVGAAVDTYINFVLFFVPGPYKASVTEFADRLVTKAIVVVSAARSTGKQRVD